MITFHNLGRQGRFGNQLFQIASTIGVARARGFEFVFKQWFNHDHVKHNPKGSLLITDIFKNALPAYGEQLTGTIKTMPLEYNARAVASVNDHDRLTGFMQSEKYFAHVADEIRFYFELKNEIVFPWNTCAIHVRRGDYTQHGGYPLTTLDYYERAIKHLQQRGFDHGELRIYSDDIAACQKMFSSINIHRRAYYDLTFVYSPNVDDYKKDFIEMRGCDFHIISNSTFSWWTAWLAHARARCVIAPKQWFENGFKNANDIIPDRWIKL